MITYAILILTIGFSVYAMNNSDIKYKYLFHPYSIKCEKSVKNGKEHVGEYTLNKKYADAGFYAVILADPRGHVNHIGWGQHIPREWD